MHRFVWDLHYASAPGGRANYPIGATPYDTAPAPTSPWVLPGTYHVRLVVNGKAAGQQTLKVEMDPRVKTPPAALRQQFELSRRLADALQVNSGLIEQVRKLRKERPQDQELAALEGRTEDPKPWAKPQTPALVPWNARIAGLYDMLQSTDAAPTPQGVQAATKVLQEADELVARARKVMTAQK